MKLRSGGDGILGLGKRVLTYDTCNKSAPHRNQAIAVEAVLSGSSGIGRRHGNKNNSLFAHIQSRRRHRWRDTEMDIKLCRRGLKPTKSDSNIDPDSANVGRGFHRTCASKQAVSDVLVSHRQPRSARRETNTSVSSSTRLRRSSPKTPASYRH